MWVKDGWKAGVIMQKMIYVETKYMSEVNQYLKSGWKVVSVTPAIYGDSTYNCGAYVVIEKEGGDQDA